MKKKILPVLILTLVISLINTGMLVYLIFGGASSPFKNRPVVISRDYDKGQSIQKAIKQDKPMIVWFYVDWCGYCQKFAPTFKKLAKDKDIKKNFAIAYVNAEDNKNEDFVKEYNITGYPMVFLVKDGKRELIPVMELFSYNAKDALKTKFLDFLKEE